MVDLKDVHILVVEDDDYSAEVLSGLLHQLKTSYTVLFDSRKVADVIRTFPRLDAVFLDLDMPGANGYVVLQTIRDAEDLKHIPVVAYTAYLNEMSNAREAGFHSFLGKPLRASLFPEQLNSILENRPVWAIR